MAINFFLLLVWYFLDMVMVELLSCWLRGVGRHRKASVWGVILQFIMWNICREWNIRIFKGEERSIIELKRIFLSFFV